MRRDLLDDAAARFPTPLSPGGERALHEERMAHFANVRGPLFRPESERDEFEGEAGWDGEPV